MTNGPKKEGVELMTKQLFLKCSNSTGCLFVIKLYFKLLVILVYICWSLKVHSEPERISLQVLQIKHFPCNKGMRGCKLRGNIVMKCETSMMNDSEGFKGIEIEEDKNIAWKKGLIFCIERSPSDDYSCFKLWKFLLVNLCSQTWWIKMF